MGNAALRDLAAFESFDGAAKRSELAAKTLVVDAPNWLYKYLTTTARFTDTDRYTTAEGREAPELLGVPKGLVRFAERNITPVFVFDGGYDDRKTAEVERRAATRREAEAARQDALDRGDSIAAAKLDARTQRLDQSTLATTKQLLDACDIPYYDAPLAAEAECALRTQNSDIDGSVSDDYDSLLFGATVTYRNFTSGSKPLERMGCAETLTKHDVTHEQLIDVALLCGTDYNDGIHGVGVKTALSGVRKHGDGLSFARHREFEADWLTEFHALRALFSSPPVASAPEAPRDWRPDGQVLRSILREAAVDTESIDASLTTLEEFGE
jgi:flap endonuclease-1